MATIDTVYIPVPAAGKVNGKAVTIPFGKERINALIEKFGPDIIVEAFTELLTKVANRRMTNKAVKEAPTEAQKHAAAMKIAEENIAKLEEKGDTGKKVSRAKSTESKAVLQEALELARKVVLDRLTAAGKKVRFIPKPQITAFAKAMLEKDHDNLVAQAKENIERRKSLEESDSDLTTLFADLANVQESDELKAKDEKGKAKRKRTSASTTSGKPQQAQGRVVPPSRPRPEQHTSH